MDVDAPLTFRVHRQRLAVVRLGPEDPLPPWAEGEFFCAMRTGAELSLVVAEARAPQGGVQVRGRVALGIEGVIPMSTVGLLARLCGALAEASVPVFVLSTYDTDWLLVEFERLGDAARALTRLGHRVVGELDGVGPAGPGS